MTEHLQPVDAGRRIQLLDILRGTAIFGILAVNMPLMNAPITTILASVRLWEGLPDRIMEVVITLFFEGKFYALFSLLFGYGFWLFLNKPSAEGRSVLPPYRRRVFVLLIIGILHVVLLWAGDILIYYALFGFLLILFRKASDRKLFRWAIALILIPIILTFIMTLMVSLAGFDPEAAAGVQAGLDAQKDRMNAQVMKALEIYSQGSFAEIVRMRIAEWLTLLPGLLFFYPNVMAMFLLGMLAGRRRYLAESESHAPLFKKILHWGLIVGLPANIFFAWAAYHGPSGDPTWPNALGVICFGFGGPALTLAYISGIVLLFRKGCLKKAAAWLAPVGRMALTNYLLHSVISALLYHSYGFGLYGKVSIWQSFLIAAAIFAFQAAGSRLWLSRFRFGPMERLWRTLTYLKPRLASTKP